MSPTRRSTIRSSLGSSASRDRLTVTPPRPRPQEVEVAADVTFPAPPLVVSLQDYGDAAAAPERLLAGYPVVCVTVSA